MKVWIHCYLAMSVCVFCFADRVSDEWIVGWSDSRLEIEDARNAGFEVTSLDPNWALLRGSEVRDPSFLRRFKRIQPNFKYSSHETELEKSWGLLNEGKDVPGTGPGTRGSDIGALGAWSIHSGSASVIAVLDSGIDRKHEDLSDNIWNNSGEIENNGIDDDGNGFIDDKFGWNFVSENNNPQDDRQHGTFVSGIIGASHNGVGIRGVLAHVSLMPVKILDSGGWTTTSRAIAGIDYAVRNGALVINASWGGNEFDTALYEKIHWAGQKNVLFVTAAGNRAENNDHSPSPTYPASFGLESIVSVAAYDAKDELGSMSSFGKRSVHVGAPGIGIYSTIPGGYRYGSGTSYAAPFVTGVAALLKSYKPHLNLAELKDRLLWTSDPLHYYEKERTQTGGRVHALNALTDRWPQRPLGPKSWKNVSDNFETAHPYENSQTYSFEIHEKGAQYIRVHFKNFRTEYCCDRVTLKDRQSKIVAVYRGNLGDFWSADAIGDLLTIELKSDAAGVEYGFEIDGYSYSIEKEKFNGFANGIPRICLPSPG